MSYRPLHLKLQELVDPGIYGARGERAWELLQPSALRTLDLLRDKFGPITVNNWHNGGAHKESGLRRFDTTTGAVWSMHRYGGAFDCKFQKTTARQVYDYVLAHPDEFPELTTVENIDATPTWFHFDVRNHDKAGIWVVNP